MVRIHILVYCGIMNGTQANQILMLQEKRNFLNLILRKKILVRFRESI